MHVGQFQETLAPLQEQMVVHREHVFFFTNIELAASSRYKMHMVEPPPPKYGYIYNIYI